MALVNQKFTVTITDDFATDPVVNQTTNFTEDAYDNYEVNTVKIAAGAAASWDLDTPTLLFDFSTAPVPQNAKYVMLVVDNPIYIWVGASPEITEGEIIETTFPKIAVKNFFVLSGSTPKVYAVNPSRSADVSPVDANIKMVIVYA